MALAGEPRVTEVLEAYLDVFTRHYLNAKRQQPMDLEDVAHARLRDILSRNQSLAP